MRTLLKQKLAALRRIINRRKKWEQVITWDDVVCPPHNSELEISIFKSNEPLKELKIGQVILFPSHSEGVGKSLHESNPNKKKFKIKVKATHGRRTTTPRARA